MLLFVVARIRLDRYEELRQHFADWRDVGVVLDRREGDRRELDRTVVGAERRQGHRRHRPNGEPSLKLEWCMVDTDEVGRRS